MNIFSFSLAIGSRVHIGSNLNTSDLLSFTDPEDGLEHLLTFTDPEDGLDYYLQLIES